MPRAHLALIVDDDPWIREAAQDVVTSLGHTWRAAGTQEETEAALGEQRFCYVLLDLELPLRKNALSRLQTGFNILALIRERYPRCELPVIVMTAHGQDHELAVRALQLEASDFVKKPFDEDFEPLEDKINKVLARTCERRARCLNELGPPEPAPQRLPLVLSTPGDAQPGIPTFHFDGEGKRRRYRLLVDGHDLQVRLGSFELLLRLAAAVVRGGKEGWVPGLELHPSNYHNALSRARADLRQQAGPEGLEELIENDGHGSFRLAVPPENLSFDHAQLSANHPGLTRELLDGL